MNDELRRKLINEAKEGMRNSHSPFSHFKVGAAILTEEGKIYRGCNIENASYGLTICGERTAIFKAISEGEHSFTAVAIVSSSNDETFPCGACRQILFEFMKEDAEVIVEDKDGNIKVYGLAELLPHGFKI